MSAGTTLDRLEVTLRQAARDGETITIHRRLGPGFGHRDAMDCPRRPFVVDPHDFACAAEVADELAWREQMDGQARPN